MTNMFSPHGTNEVDAVLTDFLAKSYEKERKGHFTICVLLPRKATNRTRLTSEECKRDGQLFPRTTTNVERI